MAEPRTAAHMERIRELSRPGEALAPNAPTATVRNPEWFRSAPGSTAPMATPQRAKLHRRLLEEARGESPNVEQNRRAVVLAGPPGAGKSTALSEVLGKNAEKFLVLDADNFKTALLQEARRDGSYEQHIKPDAVRAAESETGAKFYPLEMASLVHEESSMLSKQLRANAIERGDNIVVDTVLSSESSAREIGKTLEQAGYDVQVVDVEVPESVSQDRIRSRWEQAYETAERDGDGMGGRWVPSEYARDVFNGPDGKSKPEHAAQVLAETCPAVTRYRVYRTTEEQAKEAQPKPTVEKDLSRANAGSPLVDTQQLETQKRLGLTQQNPAQRTIPRSPTQGRGRE